MSVLQSQSTSNTKQSLNSLKFTISEMKFKQPHPHLSRSQRRTNHHQFYMHSASHQLIHRAMSYKSQKEKRMHRLKQQPHILRLEDNVLHEVQSQMLKTWNVPFNHFHPKNTQAEVTQNNEIQPMPGQLSERLSARKKLPTLKYDIDIKRKKSESAKRDIKPSPAELFTRKLEFEGRAKKLEDPQKLPLSKPKTSNASKIDSLKQRYKEKPIFVKLSGWQLQHSVQYHYPPSLFNC